MKSLAGIDRQEFLDFCDFTKPASANGHYILSHESRVLLFLYRFVQDASADVLGALFGISRKAAMRNYDDILFWLFGNCPYIPRVWNDTTATMQEITALLRQIQQNQSLGIK